LLTFSNVKEVFVEQLRSLLCCTNTYLLFLWLLPRLPQPFVLCLKCVNIAAVFVAIKAGYLRAYCRGDTVVLQQDSGEAASVRCCYEPLSPFLTR